MDQYCFTVREEALKLAVAKGFSVRVCRAFAVKKRKILLAKLLSYVLHVIRQYCC